MSWEGDSIVVGKKRREMSAGSARLFLEWVTGSHWNGARQRRCALVAQRGSVCLGATISAALSIQDVTTVHAPDPSGSNL